MQESLKSLFYSLKFKLGTILGAQVNARAASFHLLEAPSSQFDPSQYFLCEGFYPGVVKHTLKEADDISKIWRH